MIGELAISDMTLLFDLTVGGSVELDGSLEPPVAYLPTNPYMGPYTVTPGEEEQVLATEGMSMTGDVTVEPIPSNYGRIAWNGAAIMVY